MTDSRFSECEQIHHETLLEVTKAGTPRSSPSGGGSHLLFTRMQQLQVRERCALGYKLWKRRFSGLRAGRDGLSWIILTEAQMVCAKNVRVLSNPPYAEVV